MPKTKAKQETTESAFGRRERSEIDHVTFASCLRASGCVGSAKKRDGRSISLSGADVNQEIDRSGRHKLVAKASYGTVLRDHFLRPAFDPRSYSENAWASQG